MHKSPKTIWVVLVTIFVSLFPFIFAIVSLRIYGELNYPKWESLDSPPETPVRFIAGNIENDESGDLKNYKGRKTKIYVETTTGNIYQCCSKDSLAWEKVKKDDVKEANWAGYCLKNGRDENIKHIEGEIDSYALYWCGEADFGTVYYALRKDGTVWVWKQYGRWIDGGILFCKSFSVGIFLIIVVAIVLEVRKRMHKNTRKFTDGAVLANRAQQSVHLTGGILRHF